MNTKDTLPELSDTVGLDQVTSLPADPTSTEKDTLSGHTTDGGTLSTKKGQVITRYKDLYHTCNLYIVILVKSDHAAYV